MHFNGVEIVQRTIEREVCTCREIDREGGRRWGGQREGGGGESYTFS